MTVTEHALYAHIEIRRVGDGDTADGVAVLLDGAWYAELVDTDGRPTNITMIDGHPYLSEGADDSGLGIDETGRLYVAPASISRHAVNLSISRGGTRTGIGVKTDVGLCTFTLLNSQDPLAGGSLSVGQAIEVVASGVPIFTGTIADIASAYPLDKTNGSMRTSVVVTVADAVSTHATTPRYGALIGSPYYETFEARIGRLAGSAQAPIEVPVEGAPREVYAL